MVVRLIWISFILEDGLDDEDGSLGSGLDMKSANSASMVRKHLDLGDEGGEWPFDLEFGISDSGEGMNVRRRMEAVRAHWRSVGNRAMIWRGWAKGRLVIARAKS